MTTANPDILVRNAQNTLKSHRSRLLAWGVHALTMSGLVFASLAMLSVIHNEIRWMWLWLALAMIVDGVDGTCARRARVKEVIPWFDGGVLDILLSSTSSSRPIYGAIFSVESSFSMEISSCQCPASEIRPCFSISAKPDFNC